LLAGATAHFDDVDATLEMSGHPFVLDRLISPADRLRVLAAVRAASLFVRDGMRHDRRRQRRERFGVLLTLLRVRVPAALLSLPVACSRLVIGRRHALALRADDLLVRKR
jgi:hypothetical protein